MLRTRGTFRRASGVSGALLAALALVAPASPLLGAEDGAPLPAGPTAAERALPPPTSDGASPPPGGWVHTPAEYDGNLGLLVRWGVFNTILSEIAVAATTLDEHARMWVVVSDSSQQSSATASLTAAGADLSRVEFLVAPTNSVWIRDYGPRFVVEERELAIVDHTYNRPRPQDNLIPGVVAADWSLPLYDVGLVHGGGNFHLFSDGEAFMTELILAENPTLTATEVEERYAEFQNLDLTIWPGFPTSYDSTRHLDMWFLPVRDGVAIVNEYDAAQGSGIPRTITEGAVTDLLARGYTVHRLPGWRAGGVHYTYANAVVLNDVVMIPEYTPYPLQNGAAVAAYQAAFPGRTIVPIDSDAVVSSAGVLHCIVMHVPDPDWLFEDDFETGDTTVWSSSVP
jgi:agmatine/peptidylarginine deiminase